MTTPKKPSSQDLGFYFAPTSLDDLDELVACRIAAMRPGLEQLGRFHPDKARAHVVNGYRAEDTFWLMSDADSRLGWTAFAKRNDESGPYWQLDRLYLYPEYSNQRWGSQVLAWLCARADAEKIRIKLTALLGSRANYFYLKFGFKETARMDIDVHYVRHPISR